MSGYPGPSQMNPYWYYDSHGYQPNVSVSFNTNISVNTPPHPSFGLYNHNTNNSSRFADSGYLSRTPTPPTPTRASSPQSIPMKQELDQKEIESRITDKSFVEPKPRLPYVKRTRIQYTLQQLQILEDTFQHNHYPEVTTVDALAELLDVRHEKISIWFQNRRSRFKRQQKPKSTPSTNDCAKKPMASLLKNQAYIVYTYSHAAPSIVPSSTYDASVPYYPSYFWSSPTVDARTTAAYSTNAPIPAFYDSTMNSMWNTNNMPYLSPTTWHQSSSSTMNVLMSSPSSPCPSLLPEHLS